MTSLLEDVNRILDLGYGDIQRLKKIKEILEQNKMLYVADRKYLLKLVQDHPEKPQLRKSRYETQKTTSDQPDEMDLEELEEKIRVESEPS